MHRIDVSFVVSICSICVVLWSSSDDPLMVAAVPLALPWAYALSLYSLDTSWGICPQSVCSQTETGDRDSPLPKAYRVSGDKVGDNRFGMVFPITKASKCWIYNVPRTNGNKPSRPWHPRYESSTSIRHRSDTKVSERCLIDVDLKVFAVWDVALAIWVWSLTME